MEAVDLAVFILIGGKSTRMGTDKAFVTLEGRTLLSRMLELAHSVAPDVSIVGAREKYAAFAPVIEDAFPGCGPLAGIHAALRSSQKELNLILAVDVPFVSLAWLQYLIMRARGLPSAMVTVARSNQGWQPLCAIYRRQFADIAGKNLSEGQYKIDALFDGVETQVIGPAELEAIGIAERVFRNLNTPEDLAAASC
jgi:molybdopterin-guanine dinucleotide biosynthesis protein A